MLTKTLKISDTSKKEFLQLIFSHSDQKIYGKYCHGNLSSVSDRLICWLSKSVLTRGFLSIYVTPLFPVYNFKRKSPVRLNFFLKVFKILCRFWKTKTNWEHFFCYWDNCIWIVCVKHWLFLRENNCHRVSVC